MMRATIFTALIALAFGPTMAQEEQQTIGPGSSVYWINFYEYDHDQYRELLVAQGDDFAIYKTVSEYEAGDASDYFALFSGIDFHSCDMDMPDAARRQSVASLWPLEEGKSVEITLPDNATVAVGAPTEFFLMGETLPAHNVTFDYADNEENSDEVLVVLDQMPVTASIRWNETDRDTVMMITKPKDVPTADLSEETIGACASLLSETKN